MYNKIYIYIYISKVGDIIVAVYIKCLMLF